VFLIKLIKTTESKNWPSAYEQVTLSIMCCKILIPMNSHENFISGDCPLLIVYSAHKNILALLDASKTLLELSYLHWNGRVIKRSLLESSPRGGVLGDVSGRVGCTRLLSTG